MALPNVFTKEVSDQLIRRINSLSPSSQKNWGSMDVAQMLAHCNVVYEMTYDNIHAKPNPILRFILKTVVKKKIVSETPYEKNSKTAPQLVIKGSKNFENEKRRIIDYINKTHQLGEDYFRGKEYTPFGELKIEEWNNLFYKHLNHHLGQFGA
jgi:Protein of unknown function (DUF1569)